MVRRRGAVACPLHARENCSSRAWPLEDGPHTEIWAPERMMEAAVNQDSMLASQTCVPPLGAVHTHPLGPVLQFALFVNPAGYRSSFKILSLSTTGLLRCRESRLHACPRERLGDPVNASPCVARLRVAKPLDGHASIMRRSDTGPRAATETLPGRRAPVAFSGAGGGQQHCRLSPGCVCSQARTNELNSREISWNKYGQKTE